MLAPLRDYPFNEQIMICAHRGDTSHGAAENTEESIADALRSGAEMIEIDVQMTSDGVLICHHNEVSETGVVIWQTTYDDIRSQPSGISIPTFESILKLTAGNTYLNIEMKEYSARDPKVFTDALVSLVRKYGMHEYSLYSSFRIDYIRTLPWDAISTVIHPTPDYLDFFNGRSHSPLTPPKRIEEMQPSELLEFSKATTYACMISELDDMKRADIRARNIHLSLYTISTVEEYEEARSLGAKAIVTDIPNTLAKYRSNK